MALLGDPGSIRSVIIVGDYGSGKTEIAVNLALRLRAEGREVAIADLPILLPEIKGLVQDERVTSVLDVGGDTAGSRVLASLAPFATPPAHQLWFVVNARRPFCDTVDGCVRAVRRIEETSRLRVTGLIANTHLMAETTADMVAAGARLARDVGVALGVPVTLVAAMEAIAAELDAHELGAPLLVMKRIMTPPWIRPEAPRVGPPALKPGGLP